MHYERAPCFRRSKPDEALPSLWIAGVQRPGDANQYLREIGEDPPIMGFVRVGQCRACHLAAESQVVQFALYRTQTGLDVAQTFPIGRLREVHEVLVCNPRRNALLKEGSKSDKVDARKLTDLLRTGMLRPVYHGENGLRTLRELARSDQTISKDLNRVMNRLKAGSLKLDVGGAAIAVVQCARSASYYLNAVNRSLTCRGYFL
jgi:hypothetical protein